MEILLKNLDKEQRRIAEISDKNLLVLAGPGSGKTRLLTNTAAYRLRLAPHEPWRVCCLTFTVAAANELRSRLKSPELGTVPARRTWVGNFHQFAMMLLRSYGHLLGWPRTAGIISVEESAVLLQEIAFGLGMRNVDIKSLQTAISATKGRRPPPAEVDHRAESFIRLSETYQEHLRLAALRDFDDLLVDALHLLRTQPGVRRVIHDTFRHVFVDELQDTSQIQMDLLGEIVDPASVRIFGVADADQMIYAWRDARPENLEEFEVRFGAQVESLGGNYRCPDRIVRAATAVIANNPDRQRAAQDLHSLVLNAEGELWEAIAEDADDEYTLICEVIEWCGANGTPPADIAVLAPHRFKFKDLCSALQSRGIPFVYVGSGEMESCPIIRLARACLYGLANPAAPLLLSSILQQVNEVFSFPWIDEEALRHAVEVGSEASPDRLFVALQDELGLSSRSQEISPEAGERLRRLRLMLARAIFEDRPATSAELAGRVVMEWSRLEAAVLRSEQAVKLMTTFNAKGLEFDTVILPFCTRKLVPYIRESDKRDLRRWHEARRNFYVALTRSTNRVVFTRVGNEPRSMFLDEIPDELVEPWEFDQSTEIAS